MCYNYWVMKNSSIIKKENKILKIIDITVFTIALLCFLFCLVFSVIGMIAGFESPINGYGAYTAFEIVQRAGILALMLVPFVLRKCRIIIPRPVTTAFYVFLLITTFGGTFMGLYINTNWWDKFNHTLSGVLLGIAGLFFLNALTKQNDKVSAFGTFVYVFAFALMCGTVWEIYEFACDGILGSNMQKFRNDHTLVEYIGRAALTDTMGDIIVDAVGGAVAGIASAIAVSRNRNFLRIFEIGIAGRPDSSIENTVNDEVAATADEVVSSDETIVEVSEPENE